MLLFFYTFILSIKICVKLNEKYFSITCSTLIEIAWLLQLVVIEIWNAFNLCKYNKQENAVNDEKNAVTER
jgi:hypothetical protein